MQREFRFSRVFNFRDVGGYPTQDGRSVRWRRLFRSDTLSALSEADRERFLALGIRTVVDLRRQYEIDAQGTVPTWNGLVRHHIDPNHREWTENPYTDGVDTTRYLADRYLDLTEEGARGIVAALEVISEAEAAPLVVHCVAGKDRTGVVCALTLSLLGVPDEHIDADYTRSTAGNQQYVAWLRDNGYPEAVMLPWFYSPPGTMRLFLSELRQQHGSVASYLTAAGLDPERIEALRAHLLT